MQRSFKTIAGVVALVLLPAAIAAAGGPDWPHWRGPEVSGIAPSADPPLEWSETKNVRWKVPLAGQGLSTPIVWDDLVILQAAIPADASAAKKEAKERAKEQRERGERSERPREERRARERRRDRGDRGDRGNRGPRGGRRGGDSRTPQAEAQQFTVIAFDRQTGETKWQKVVREEVPHEGSHPDGSLAPASPITDGEHLYAYFGSRGLYKMTKSGEVVWEKDLGDMKTRSGFGEGSSPALSGDALIVNWDHEGDSFIVALDKNTGEERWRKARDEPTSWSTPVIVEDGGKSLAIVSATNRVRAYDVATGDVVWEVGGLGLNATPTPIVKDDMVWVMTGYRDSKIMAVRYKGATGDITGSDRVVWSDTKGTSYVPSGLLYGDALYYLQRNNAILSCVDPMTGSPHYEQTRLEAVKGVYASLTGAAGRVYVVGRNGTTQVLRAGKTFETLATNELEDSFSASPAIADGEIFLRGMKSLYCIAKE